MSFKQIELLITGLLFLGCGIAAAGLHLGLGRAVSKHAEAVMSKASEQTTTTGAPGSAWSGASTLASCSAGAIFSTAPIAMADFLGIAPLGNLNPTGHTLPTKHLYFCGVAGSTATIYFPADARLTLIAQSENLTLSTTDYSLNFSPCKELGAYFLHVLTLDNGWASQIGSFSGCSTYTTGGQTYRYCSKNVSIDVSAGQVVGTAKFQACWDFGVRDSRIASLGFVNPARYRTAS
ncbi:MAG: hypothetical protein AABZ44_00905, partial [Elusimicrobiota bacterium]